MSNTKFNQTANGLEIQTTVNIPLIEFREGCKIVDRDAFNIDIIGSFSKRIIESLERRKEACKRLLLNNIDNVVFNDGDHIMYVRKDNTQGNFNVTSFKEMDNCIKALKNSSYREVLKNHIWIDQILKALLNDTEQDHSDANIFKYSQLVSLLCENHMFYR